MKKLLLLMSFFLSIAAFAQKGSSEASWKVVYGKKTLLKATGEDEATNVVSIRRADLKKRNLLTVTYCPSSAQTHGWNRTITVYDGSDSELSSQKGNKLTLSSATLARLAKGQSELKIYTMAVPSDPARAAVVRVRRMHLVTIRITG